MWDGLGVSALRSLDEPRFVGIIHVYSLSGAFLYIHNTIRVYTVVVLIITKRMSDCSYLMIIYLDLVRPVLLGCSNGVLLGNRFWRMYFYITLSLGESRFVKMTAQGCTCGLFYR